MVKRISTTIVLILSVIFLPYWITYVLALLGIIYFPVYFEALGALLISDLLFGIKEPKLHYTVFVSFLIFVMVILVIEILKRKLKFYT